MIRLRQSNLDPGNCLQTCIACILEIDVDVLPPQAEILRWSPPRRFYERALSRYLRKHHSFVYLELPIGLSGAVRPVRDLHVMCGAMRRRWGAVQGICEDHCVVGCRGRPIWDPYPGHHGLERVDHWGLIGPLTLARPTSPPRSILEECLCPGCALDEARAAVVSTPWRR